MELESWHGHFSTDRRKTQLGGVSSTTSSHSSWTDREAGTPTLRLVVAPARSRESAENGTATQQPRKYWYPGQTGLVCSDRQIRYIAMRPHQPRKNDLFCDGLFTIKQVSVYGESSVGCAQARLLFPAIWSAMNSRRRERSMHIYKYTIMLLQGVL
jgi:hypothetical protein